jgi:hypothetical protein
VVLQCDVLSGIRQLGVQVILQDDTQGSR